MTLKEELAVALDVAVKPVKPVAPIGGKKGENTPIEDCKAKNPMLCPYHGAKKIEDFLNSKSTTGLKFTVEKKGNGKYAISCTYHNGNYEAWTDAENCIKALQKVNGFQSFGKNKDAPSDDVDNLTKFSNELSMNPDDAIGGLSEDVDKLDKDIFGADDLDPEAAEAISDVELALEQPEEELDYDTLNDLYKKAKILHAYKGDIPAVMEKGMEALSVDQQLPVDELQQGLFEMLENAKGAFPDGIIPDKFPGIHSLKDAKLALDSAQNQLVGAQANFMEATEFGDLFVAKEALSLMDDAANKYKDAYDLYKKHVDAMSENFGKCYGEKDWKNVPLTYPKDLLTNPGDKAENVPGQQSEQTPNKESLLNLWLVTHGSDLLKYHGLKATKANKAALAEEMKQLLNEGKINPHLNSDGIIAASISNGDVTDADLLADFFEHMKSGKPKTAKSKKTDEPITEVPQKDLPTEMLKPLEHDESKFPQFNSEKELLAAIKSSVSAGGGGGLGTKIVTMKDGTKFVMKKGTGDAKDAIVNGFNCDMAYRAGGIHSPDAKLYEFDGKVYKLAEFIEGTRLDKMVTKDSKTGAWNVPQAVRDEMLKGYPLDCLFSNWDVLGTNEGGGLRYTNIIVDKDGHCWRLDNDGAFAASGLVGGQKSTDGKLKAIRPVEYEKWDSWEDRQWIDDFRTMRVEKMNQGVFDGYSTADIFLSAGNINMAHAVASLPKDLQKALKKPLFEMNQMATHAVSANISGIKNRAMLTSALDTMYEASKRNMRQLSHQKIFFGEKGGGFGNNAQSDSIYQIQPYSVKKPEKPVNPDEQAKAPTFLNKDYTGSDKIAKAIMDAAKTINYHAGFTMKDQNGVEQGHSLDNPDYHPNQDKLNEFKKINRDKLVELAKTDENAKKLLGSYDAVKTSMDNGFKSPVSWVDSGAVIKAKLPDSFKTKEEIEYEQNHDKVMAEYQKKMDAYSKELATWEDGNQKHLAKEYEKAKKSGKNPYKNFNDFADQLCRMNINTDGVEQGNGEGIDIIEDGKHHNKFGGNYSALTSEDSWTPPSSKLKVLELVLRGMTPEQIAKIPDNDPLLNNGHHSSSKAKKWFIGEATKYAKDPAAFAKDCLTYARWKGLQTLKLENEFCDVEKNGKTHHLVRHETHSVGLARKDATSGKKGTITKVEQKAANTSCGFQHPGSFGGHNSFVYDVPFWNICYSYSDHNRPNSPYPAHVGSEHEWVATLIGLTPYCANAYDYLTDQMDAMKTTQFQQNAEARAKRLAPFMTSITDIM